MDNEEILNRMHQLHLLLADELKRICEKHDIEYFMLAGTLLGAVRHKGFIPWDDDMDFGMTRNNFEHFLSIADNELDPEIFYLQTDRKEKNYPFNFAKLRLVGTTVTESFSENTGTNQGIYIDVFPLDVVSDNKVRSFIQYKAFFYYRNLLWIKCGYGSKERKRELAYKAAKLLSQLYSIDYLKKKKNEVLIKYRDSETKSVVAGDGSYGLKRETLPYLWLKSLSVYTFEDREYPGFSEYDQYLRHLYQDYMRIPPESERNHHTRMNVDFGRYADYVTNTMESDYEQA